MLQSEFVSVRFVSIVSFKDKRIRNESPDDVRSEKLVCSQLTLTSVPLFQENLFLFFSVAILGNFPESTLTDSWILCSFNLPEGHSTMDKALP